MKAIAGAALIGLVVVGPVDVVADAVEVKIDLTMKEAKCVGDIAGGQKVTYTRRDVLVFSFYNACEKEQRVIVCAEPRLGTTTTYPVPWARCKGFPELAPAVVGTQFRIKAKKTANALCSVLWPDAAGSFEGEDFNLEVSTAVSGILTCPKPKKVDGKFYVKPGVKPAPELALEVDP